MGFSDCSDLQTVDEKSVGLGSSTTFKAAEAFTNADNNNCALETCSLILNPADAAKDTYCTTYNLADQSFTVDTSCANIAASEILTYEMTCSTKFTSFTYTGLSLKVNDCSSLLTPNTLALNVAKGGSIEILAASAFTGTGPGCTSIDSCSITANPPDAAIDACVSGTIDKTVDTSCAAFKAWDNINFDMTCGDNESSKTSTGKISL